MKTGASRVHVGLRFTADWETLDMEPESNTIQGKKQTVSEVTVRFYKSRLPRIGPNKDHLLAMQQREGGNMGVPTTLLSGDRPQVIPESWSSNGRMFFRQSLPLPTTILAIIPDVEIGDRDDAD